MNPNSTEEAVKHTPGPWRDIGFSMLTGKDRHYGWAITDSYGSKFAEVPVQRGSWTFDRDTQEANARLIAVAPELLEVLKLVLETRRPTLTVNHQFDPRPDDHCDCLLCQIERVIAKAEGR